MPGNKDEVIQKGIAVLEDAIVAAKEYLEDYFSSEIDETGYEIDEDSFYVTEDWEQENTWNVHMVANSFGDLSEFYVQIIDEQFQYRGVF